MTDLGVRPPVTLGHLHARHRWILPAAATLVVALAFGAAADRLWWDEPITEWVLDRRTARWNSFFRRVSFLGSTRVVVVATMITAAFAWRRDRRLAVAILVVAVARPLAEWSLKELVDRERPSGDRLVAGRGPSFPSGHPLATAASWGMLPLVVALYTRRRLLWWVVAVGVWTLALLVAASRVWLGVHWASDVVAGLAVAVLGVAATERLLYRAGIWARPPAPSDAGNPRVSARASPGQQLGGGP